MGLDEWRLKQVSPEIRVLRTNGLSLPRNLEAEKNRDWLISTKTRQRLMRLAAALDRGFIWGPPGGVREAGLGIAPGSAK